MQNQIQRLVVRRKTAVDTLNLISTQGGQASQGETKAKFHNRSRYKEDVLAVPLIKLPKLSGDGGSVPLSPSRIDKYYSSVQKRLSQEDILTSPKLGKTSLQFKALNNSQPPVQELDNSYHQHSKQRRSVRSQFRNSPYLYLREGVTPLRTRSPHLWLRAETSLEKQKSTIRKRQGSKKNRSSDLSKLRKRKGNSPKKRFNINDNIYEQYLNGGIIGGDQNSLVVSQVASINYGSQPSPHQSISKHTLGTLPIGDAASQLFANPINIDCTIQEDQECLVSNMNFRGRNQQIFIKMHAIEGDDEIFGEILFIHFNNVLPCTPKQLSRDKIKSVLRGRVDHTQQRAPPVYKCFLISEFTEDVIPLHALKQLHLMHLFSKLRIENCLNFDAQRTAIVKRGNQCACLSELPHYATVQELIEMRVSTANFYTEEEILHLTECILNNLIAFHNQGLVHSAINTDNIGFFADNTYRLIAYEKFIDVVDTHNVDKNRFIGANDPNFIPPELKRRQQKDHLPHSYSLKCAEMYALGVTLLIIKCGIAKDYLTPDLLEQKLNYIKTQEPKHLSTQLITVFLLPDHKRRAQYTYEELIVYTHKRFKVPNLYEKQLLREICDREILLSAEMNQIIGQSYQLFNDNDRSLYHLGLCFDQYFPDPKKLLADSQNSQLFEEWATKLISKLWHLNTLKGKYERANYYQSLLRIKLNVDEQVNKKKNFDQEFVHSGYEKLSKMNFAEARDDYEQVLRIREEKDELQTADTAYVHSNLGQIYMELKDIDKAVQHFSKALEIIQELKDPKNDSILCSLLSNLAIYYEKTQKDFARALEYYKQIIVIKKRLKDPSVYKISAVVARLCYQLKDYAAAEQFYKETLQAKEDLFAPGEAEVLNTRLNLAITVWHRDRQEAWQILEKNVQDIKEHLKDQQKTTALREAAKYFKTTGNSNRYQELLKEADNVSPQPQEINL